MGEIHVRFRDAKREPLADTLDVRVVMASTNRVVSHQTGISGRARLKVPGVHPGQPYVVMGFPRRHRPVGQVVLVPMSGPARVDLFFPLHPDHVRAEFPDYGSLDVALRTVLERSTLETGSGPGQALYDSLVPVERAGLLNLFCKMSAFGFDERHTVWSAVESVYRVRPDRIFANVDVALRDRVKSAEIDGRFREVSGKLHTPPPGFRAAGSFKTDDRYGNLQLSFFASDAEPIAFKVDADIDDAAGLAHGFQVLRNFVTSGTTHPYDIHQILVFRQEAQPAYELA